ncbi:hypothetical protein SCA6_002836 [Theobroma cacao]
MQCEVSHIDDANSIPRSNICVLIFLTYTHILFKEKYVHTNLLGPSGHVRTPCPFLKKHILHWAGPFEIVVFLTPPIAHGNGPSQLFYFVAVEAVLDFSKTRKTDLKGMRITHDTQERDKIENAKAILVMCNATCKNLGVPQTFSSTRKEGCPNLRPL